MPLYRCLNPICSAYLRERGFCDACQKLGHRGTRHTYYDHHQRDPEAKAFYNSAAWQNARARKLTATPFCERCPRLATTVHHVVPVKVANPQQRVDQALLMSLCASCHNAVEAETDKRTHARN